MDSPTSFVDGALDDQDCAKALANAIRHRSICQILERLRRSHGLKVCAQNCNGESLRGYFEVPPGETIVLCCNNLQHEQILMQTLQHELVHAVDYLERGYNFHDPVQLACSEVLSHHLINFAIGIIWPLAAEFNKCYLKYCLKFAFLYFRFVQPPKSIAPDIGGY
jgi:hypothetical protein